MNTANKIYGFTLALACSLVPTLNAQNMYVANIENNTIGEYGTDGSPVSAALISGLHSPYSLAISGTNLFVANYSSGTIGEYTTSGATVDASLISGLNEPFGIAISGTNLFVLNEFGNTIEYTTSGTTVNASLLSGESVVDIAISSPPSTNVPALKVAWPGNAVTIYWLAISGWNLQQNTNIATANWVNSSPPVTTSDGTKCVSIVSPSGNMFFRLQGQ